MKSHEAATAITGKQPRPRARKDAVKLRPMPPGPVAAVRALDFTVNGPPMPWQRPRRTQRGVWFTPKETIAHERSVKACAQVALMQLGGPNTWPQDAYYRATVRLWFADARRKDADNCAKAVLDGLNEVLYADDSQVIDLVVSRRIDRENPRTDVTIEVLAC